MTTILKSPARATSPAALAETCALVIAVLTAGATLAWVLWRSRYGLDFTDESFYLIWISDPSIYSASVTQFGFIYHPFYRLVGGDIVSLRQFNIVITYGLAWLLCAALHKSTAGAGETAKWPETACISAVLASGSLLVLEYIGMWVPTPSYNSLAFQALLLAATGIMLAKRNATSQSVIGWSLIGIAGWLAFMAKPTTAAALVPVVGLCLLMEKKMRIRLLMIPVSIAVILMLGSAWIIDGSVQAFAARLMRGVADAGSLAGGHTSSQLLRVDSFSLSSGEKIMLALLSFWVAAGTWLSATAHAMARIIIPVIALIIFVAALALALGVSSSPGALSQFGGLLLWAAPLGTAVALLVSLLGPRPAYPFVRERLGLVLCLAVFPHLYAFGTNGNYWASGASAGIFWVLSGVVLARLAAPVNFTWRTLLPVASGAQAIILALLYASMANPYRQPQPLQAFDDQVEIGLAGTSLVVANDFGKYFRALKRIAATGGFTPGTPMLDLTGHYPGALYSIGAKSVGQAWLVGGYKGSERFANAALSRVPCEDIGKAWILTEPNGPRKLSADILRLYGADLERDYIVAGRLASPKGSFPQSYEQVVYRPARELDEAQAACKRKRIAP